MTSSTSFDPEEARLKATACLPRRGTAVLPRQCAPALQELPDLGVRERRRPAGGQPPPGPGPPLGTAPPRGADRRARHAAERGQGDARAQHAARGRALHQSRAPPASVRGRRRRGRAVLEPEPTRGRVASAWILLRGVSGRRLLLLSLPPRRRHGVHALGAWLASSLSVRVIRPGGVGERRSIA
jgi:hypothetical protein